MIDGEALTGGGDCGICAKEWLAVFAVWVIRGRLKEYDDECGRRHARWPPGAARPISIGRARTASGTFPSVQKPFAFWVSRCTYTSREPVTERGVRVDPEERQATGSSGGPGSDRSGRSNGGGSKADPVTTATTPTTAATTTSTPEQAVLAGYRAFWDGYLKAADPMDPRSPVLARVATGDELEQLQRAFLARQSVGEVIRGTLDLAPLVKTVDGSSATVTDCYADHTGIYDAASGARKDRACRRPCRRRGAPRRSLSR